jgi:hypothetical protein
MNRNDQQFMAQKIRTQYMEKTPSELDELRKLDSKIKRPANVFAYVFGSLSAIIMGAGMSLIMTELAQILGTSGDAATVIGIGVGIVGGILASLAYPMYNVILKAERKRIAPEIIRLTDELMK